MAKKKIAFNSDATEETPKERITSYDQKDKEQDIIKKVLGGRTPKAKEDIKSEKKLLSFTKNEIVELEKVQKILGDATFNKTIYRLIELGKEHIKESM